MVKIRLCCVTGMLSSLLVTKIRDAAKLRQIDIDIKSLAINSIKEELNKGQIDVILVGPHIQYKLSKIQDICKGKQVALGMISMQDYGFMDGNSILTTALNLLEQAKADFLKAKEAEKLQEQEKQKQKELEEEQKKQQKLKAQASNNTTPVKNVPKSNEHKDTNVSEKINNAAQAPVKKSETAASQSTVSEDTIQSEQTESSKEIVKNTTSTYGQYKFTNISSNINNFKGVNNMIKKVKELLLDSEKEVYMSTNIDINEFEEELNEISQRGVRVTIIAPDKYNYDSLQIDKLYEYSTEKIRNNKPKMTLVVDNNIALVSEVNPTSNDDINYATTDNKILVDTIARNVDNYIYVLKLRDNIDFKLRDL